MKVVLMKMVFDESDHFHPNFDESVPNRPGSFLFFLIKNIFSFSFSHLKNVLAIPFSQFVKVSPQF